ncbi:hypothetical protein BH23GEM11_BH23GEM11_07120 [soil metagenome]
MTEHTQTRSAGTGPRPDAAAIRAMIRRETALPSRLGHTALLVAGLLMAGVTAALLLTEVGLPMRTRIAFAAMLVIGLSWSAFAGWVLARRRVLFAQHRVISGFMAVLFTGVFTVGAVLVGQIPAAAVGVTLCGVAGMLLVRARAKRAALMQRRSELEQALRTPEGAA